jgi:DNA-binding NarL/FixJ family response regulator
MAKEIIGREEELGSIQAFLHRVREGSGALVLSGEAGIGKTILWEAGLEEAEQSRARVLLHRGAEAEASLSFIGLSDLLASVFDEVASSLAPLRRRALEVALLLAEPGEKAPDPHAIGLALLDVLRALAERGPVIVALDDVQWLDSSSAGVLQIAFRRLRNEPIGVLATLRSAHDPAAALELERAFAEERLTRVSLGPLSLGELHRLLEERLGLALTRPELIRVQEASAGNPFFVLELGRELVRTNTRPVAGGTLPVSESLHELLDGRLARLPTETGDVVLFAAALARPTIELVSTAHGEPASVLEAVTTATQAGVLELDDSRIRFSHPLLASISYEQAPPWKRRAIHGALAEAVTDVEEEARHLALSVAGPDAVVASHLDAAAEHAAARGATSSAADLAELAAEFTPADPAHARQRRFRAATFHRLAGEGERAVALLEELLAHVPPGVERADVLLELVTTHRGNIPMLIGLADEALAEAAGDDARSAEILAARGFVHLNAANARAALADTRAALERAERAADPTLLAVAIAHAGRVEMWTAEITPGLLERGVEIEERLGLKLRYYNSPRYAFARLLTGLDEVDRARAIFEELEAKAAARGDEDARALLLWPLSMLEWLVGRWQRAVEHATVAEELTEQIDHPHGRIWMGHVKTLLAADLGLVGDARASAEEGIAHAQESSFEFWSIMITGVLGRLELALGNLEAAGGYLRELPARFLAGGVNDPTAPLWADAIETLIALGELEQARAYLEPYEANAQRLGSALARAGAARCRGLVLAAEGGPATGMATLEASLADAAPYPLERGRTLLCLGTVRRQAQQKRSAREALEQALAIFEELGARLWAEKARAELKRIGGRPRPADELTETERRVAELAARGRTNKEIAAELFMGVSTVEMHLSRVYRKLGVRSRTELAGRIATPRDQAAKASHAVGKPVDEAAEV